MAHSEIPWSVNDIDRAAAIWDEFTDDARALFSILMDHPGERFSGSELAELLGRPNPQSVAGLLSRPGTLSSDVGRQWPWHWHYPEGNRDRAVYWLSSTQAELFCAARAGVVGRRKRFAEFESVERITAVAVSGDAVRVYETVVQIGVDDVPLEALNTELYEVQGIAAGEARRLEAALADRFRQHLTAANHRVRRYRIVPDGSAACIYTDIADITSNVLYEAKGSADRMSVRLALGQVFDYGRYVRRLVPDVKLAVLLPGHPSPDMRELLEEHDVGCVVRLGSGGFADLTSLERCP